MEQFGVESVGLRPEQSVTAKKPTVDDAAVAVADAPPGSSSLWQILNTPITFATLGTVIEKAVAPPDVVRAERLATIQSEIELMSSAPIVESAVSSSPSWSTLFGDTGPFAIIKRKAARFRLPRAMKTELINRFTSTDADALASLTTMVVVAHPDDESIGAGARLRHLGDAYVIEVTDGAPRDPDCARRHGYKTREEYAEARRRELLSAMSVVGFPEERLVSLGFVDGEATLRLVELCMRVTELLDSIQPDIVLTHPYEGGHTDHDATAFAVHLACGVLRREGVQPPAVLELASYHARGDEKVVQHFLPHGGADKDQRIVSLSDEEQAIKRRMFESFTSQLNVLDRFSTAFERFRPAPRYVFTAPPHEGRLNYERYGDPSRGHAWRAQALRALRTLGMRKE